MVDARNDGHVAMQRHQGGLEGGDSALKLFKMLQHLVTELCAPLQALLQDRYLAVFFPQLPLSDLLAHLQDV